MATGKSVFVTYLLGDESVTGGTNAGYAALNSYGHAAGIHCNYIQKLETDVLSNKSINFIIPDSSQFPFMKAPVQVQSAFNGYGWTAKKLYVLAQIVDGTGSTITPNPAQWKIIDVTNQLDGYESFSGTSIPPSAFNSETIITITSTKIINSTTFYNLGYLNNPSKLSIDNDKLAFGEEVFFYGNVNTEIEAIAYTTEIPAILPLNQYNSTTNETWDEVSPVVISEIGIYDSNNNLVGIGKLNNPIEKNSTIYRTILFSIDF